MFTSVTNSTGVSLQSNSHSAFSLYWFETPCVFSLFSTLAMPDSDHAAVFDEEETEGEDEEGGESEEEAGDIEDYVPRAGPTARVSPRNSRNAARRIVFIEEEEEEEGEDEEQEEEAPFRQVTENAAENSERIRGGGGGGGEASASSSNGGGIGRTDACGDSNGNETEGVCCPICMEPWSSGNNHQVSCLPCGHVYGLSCIERWIRQCRRNNAKCPQCSRKCREKDIIKLYVSRIFVADSDHQKKILSLQSENEFLKMKIANLSEKICQEKDGRMPREETANCIESLSSGEMQRRPTGQTLSGQFFGSNLASQGSSYCRFALEDELVVDGARIFDMDASNQILILARRLSGMGGTHVLTKISLIYPYDNENIPLPPSVKAVKDLRVSPCSSRLALFASLGKKLSVLSTESNNIVLSYELPGPAWSCSWDINSGHHLYAGLQNGMVLVFDMRQTARPMESINGLTCHPVHTIHSLVHNPQLPSGVRTILTASSIGPCIWRTGNVGERPFLVPEVENEGVCISLAYCPSSDEIVASYRPKVQTSVEIGGSQLPLSPSPTIIGRGIRGSHVVIKRVDHSHYQNLGSTSANVNDVRMLKSAIVNMENCNPLFAYGDEASHGLSLWELPSLRLVQNLKPHQHPILDVKYARSLGTGLLGCVSEDRLQLFSVKPS